MQSSKKNLVKSITGFFVQKRTFTQQGLLHKNHNKYIKQKDLNDIEKVHGDTWFEKAKKYAKMATHIVKQGSKNMYTHTNRFKQLYKKQNKTKQQVQEYKEFLREFKKLKSLVFIQIMPFSGPLLFGFLYVYPSSLPLWFRIDSMHDKNQFQRMKNQQKALDYFRTNKISVQNTDLSQMPLDQLRLFSQALFGHYRDGTVGYNKIFKNKINFCLYPTFSKKLIFKTWEEEFKHDFKNEEHISRMGFDEKVKWKFEMVLKNKELLEHQSLHQIEEELDHISTDEVPKNGK